MRALLTLRKDTCGSSWTAQSAGQPAGSPIMKQRRAGSVAKTAEAPYASGQTVRLQARLVGENFDECRWFSASLQAWPFAFVGTKSIALFPFVTPATPEVASGATFQPECDV